MENEAVFNKLSALYIFQPRSVCIVVTDLFVQKIYKFTDIFVQSIYKLKKSFEEGKNDTYFYFVTSKNL